MERNGALENLLLLWLKLRIPDCISHNIWITNYLPIPWSGQYCSWSNEGYRQRISDSFRQSHEIFLIFYNSPLTQPPEKIINFGKLSHANVKGMICYSP